MTTLRCSHWQLNVFSVTLRASLPRHVMFFYIFFFLLLFFPQIFALTTRSPARRLHVFLSLPGADNGWNRRGGQACEIAGAEDGCQLRRMRRPPVVGLCVCPALNWGGTSVDTGATDVYSMAGCCSHVGTALDFFFSSWLWRLNCVVPLVTHNYMCLDFD